MSESFHAKLDRVAPLVATATADGVENAAHEAWQHKAKTAEEVGASAALGAGLATLQKSASFPKLGVEFAVAALTVATAFTFLKQGMKGFSAIGNAWSSKADLSQDRKQIANSFGGIVFDTALTLPAGMAGMLGARAIPVALEERSILLDMKDFHPETAEHSIRVGTLSQMTAKEMDLPYGLQRRAFHAGLMHDAGKLDLPFATLGRTTGLSDADWEALHQHPLDTLERLQHVHYKGTLEPVPEDASMHHEWMNGTGYPRNLKGDQIPIPARAIPPADVFDAVTGGREYMGRMPLNEVKLLMESGRGEHFDLRLLMDFGPSEWTRLSKS